VQAANEPWPEEVRELFGPLVENSFDFVAIASTDGRLVYLNDAGIALVEAGAPQAVRDRHVTDLFAPEDLPYYREVIAPELERSGRWSGDFRLRQLLGERTVHVNLNLFVLRDQRTNAPLATAIVSQDIADRRRSEQRLRALVDAGAVLSHSLDYEATFQNIADLVVRAVATFCLIDIFNEDGAGDRVFERVAFAHADRAKIASLQRLGSSVPSRDHKDHPVVRAAFDGSSSLIPVVDDEWLDRAVTSPEHAAIMRELGAHSLLTVPLVAGGKILGALTCGLAMDPASGAAPIYSYDAEDLFFVEELGRRAGAAIENARMYQHQRHIAVVLQAASLPETLARVDHLRLDAAYRPGSAEATIGGDWYDAFALEDGRIVLTVGDVLGHGLHAAITMTKLRQAMQSAAMVNADPNLMLDVADKTLRMHDADGYATALAAIYDPPSRTLTFASAGHPGPALATPDGKVCEFASPGLLLGLRGGNDRDTKDIEIPVNAVIVFFTDGLVEATRDIEEGHRRLHEALANPEIIYGPAPASSIVDAVLAGRPAGDDIAVLAATLAPPSEPAAPGDQTEYVDPTPADPTPVDPTAADPTPPATVLA
jgi:PAS domain S-box-containing protein